VFHIRTKHIELDYLFVHEKVSDGTIKIYFICSQDQVTDALTKPLSVAHFQQLRSKLIVHSSTVSLRGPINTDIQDGVQKESTQETT
jgi:hypothetical protein